MQYSLISLSKRQQQSKKKLHKIKVKTDRLANNEYTTLHSGGFIIPLDKIGKIYANILHKIIKKN